MKKRIFSSMFLVLCLSLLFSFGNSAGFIEPLKASAADYSASLPLYGEIWGDGVYGYTTGYVCHGGSKEIQHKVQNGWHVTLKNHHYSYGIDWYECYDTDDGDYYGWIDDAFIYVYGTGYPKEETVVIESFEIEPRLAEVDGNGVYGYTSDYVLYGGSQESERKVQDGWHITAYTMARSHGVLWYQCWDTDDGDYYGWIDSKYIDFYDERPQTTPAPVKTEKVTSVVTVTVPVTVTVAVPVTETASSAAETKAETEIFSLTQTTDETTQFTAEIAGIEDDFSGNDDDNNSQLLIIVIAAAVVVLIPIAAVIIAMVSKKPKYDIYEPGQAYNGDFMQEGTAYCKNCGAAITNPSAVFCPSCGKPCKR